MDTLETERLLIRPLTEDDLTLLHDLYSKMEMMQYITGRPRTLEESKAALEKILRDHRQYGFGLCATILKEGHELVGRGGLDPVVVEGELEGDIAWMFLKPYWGRGLATEFGSRILRHGFEELGLRRIFATADPRNVRSIRVMEKLGMRFVGGDHVEVEYEILNASAPGSGRKRGR